MSMLWLDGYVPYALRTGDIPGAVVTVVKDGQILTTARLRLRRSRQAHAGRSVQDPVPPGIDLQAVHLDGRDAAGRGRQDRPGQADVNTYLDFKIPPRNGKPITMRELMTHTAGFEEATKG
jgi:CubicO group peptidase (beta-lactamase class C family)